MERRKLLQDKKGMGIVSALVGGIAGLIILVIVSLLIVSTLKGAGLLTGAEQGAVGNLSANYTHGIDQISQKVPTILLVGAVVILFGAIVLLVKQSKAVQGGAGGGI